MGNRTVGQFNFRDSFVDGSSASDYTGKFVTGRTCVLAAGNPIYEDNTDINDLILIGATQNIGHNQSKQLQRLFEIGSDENSIVPGRAMGTIRLSKVWYNGPSLMKSLYPHVTEAEIDAMFKKPGYGNSFFNLQSDLADTPCGILILMYDLSNDFVGGSFLENCYLQNYGTGISAQAVILAQTVSLQYERPFPVDPGLLVLEG